MPNRSAIEWTETTWNPVTGCTKISAGCRHCYAERMARRLQGMGNLRYARGFRVALHEQLLDLPTRWTRPRMVFVNSMSDLFHESVPESFIRGVFQTMVSCPGHTFQVLTKRSERVRELGPTLPWPANVWMGVTVEDEPAVARIADLVSVPAAVRFLSCEPLLGPLPDLPLDGIHWVIVGGESGPGARPMRPEWVEAILEQCRESGVPFFFKQWGGVRKKKAGRVLLGRTFDEYPVERAPSLARRECRRRAAALNRAL
jgi:protein gp37